MSTVTEKALVFDCQGEQLVGIAHCPADASTVGVLTVVAGGPQYRAGVGRGLVAMARELADRGIPVMRFDYRGMGDSSGLFPGFEHIGPDLASAVEAFREAVPGLEHVVLWGGCDAASGILIHAHELPAVVGIAVGNPWATSPQTQAAVVRKHYLKRLGERSFWLKLLRMEYNLLDYARGALARVRGALGRTRPSGAGMPPDRGPSDNAAPVAAPQHKHFIDRMLEGLKAFDGPVLLLMSGRSLVSREFDELTQRHAEWARAVEQKVSQRIDIPEADQAFSSHAARVAVNRALLDWLDTLPR